MDTIAIKDGNGAPQKLSIVTNPDGSFTWMHVSMDFELAVSMGKVPGFWYIDKFGFSQEVGANSNKEDIWEGPTELYPYSTSNDVISISSDNINDTELIQLSTQLLDGTEVVQEITLQGQTRVALPVPCCHIIRMENEGSNDILGTVYCYSGTTETNGTPSGGSVVKAVIDDGNNQTQMAIYRVPKQTVGFLYVGELGLEFSAGPIGTEALTAQYQSRRSGGVFKVKKTISVEASGSSNYENVRPFRDVIPALTDIKLTKIFSSAVMGVNGSFTIMLVDEDKLDPAFLALIKQPGY